MGFDAVVGKESSESHAGRVLAPHPRTAHGAPSISPAACRPPRTCCVPPCSSPLGDTERKTVQDGEGFVVSSGDKRHVGIGWRSM